MRSANKGLRSSIYHIAVAPGFHVAYFYYRIIQHDAYVYLIQVIYCKVINYWLLQHHRHMFLFRTKIKKAQHLLGLEPVDGVLFCFLLLLFCQQAGLWCGQLRSSWVRSSRVRRGAALTSSCVSGELPSGERLFWAWCSEPCYSWLLQSRMWILLSPPIWCELYTYVNNGTLTCGYPWDLWVITLAHMWSTVSCSQDWRWGHCLCACPLYQYA